jgi:hypothetical protein
VATPRTFLECRCEQHRNTTCRRRYIGRSIKRVYIQLHIVKPSEYLGTHFYCDTIQCNSTALCLRLITSTSIISIRISIHIPIHVEFFTRTDDRDMSSIAFNLALDISLPSRYQILTPPFSEHQIRRTSRHPPTHSLSLLPLTLPPLTPSPQYNIHSTIHSTSQPITKPQLSFLFLREREQKKESKNSTSDHLPTPIKIHMTKHSTQVRTSINSSNEHPIYPSRIHAKRNEMGRGKGGNKYTTNISTHQHPPN